MDRTRLHTVICWVLVAAWMVVIFSFSARPVEQSDAQSGLFTHLVASVLTPGYSQMGTDDQDTAAEVFSYPVRKTAHVSEYALLGALVSIALVTSRRKPLPALPLKMGGCALLICALYASTDEIHQLFVVGRSSQFADVCIDTAGAAIGVLSVFAFVAIRARRRTNA
jgi:VanZ family protein